nr:MAG TPA: hypothetical protein [Caudoviricetes sp.]
MFLFSKYTSFSKKLEKNRVCKIVKKKKINLNCKKMTF